MSLLSTKVTQRERTPRSPRSSPSNKCCIERFTGAGAAGRSKHEANEAARQRDHGQNAIYCKLPNLELGPGMDAVKLSIDQPSNTGFIGGLQRIDNLQV